MNEVKANYKVLALGVIVVASFLGYLWMVRQDFFGGLVLWAQENLLLYFAVLVLIKMIGIVWPPLPGGLLALGSVPVIGWTYAFAADAIGGIIGASVAYFLGKKYGRKILRKFFDETTVERVDKVKIAKNHELEAIFILRLFTGSISEAISYGAGVLKVKYRSFLLGTSVAYIFFIPVFYIMGNILRPDGSFDWRFTLLNGSAVLAMGFLFYKLRGRYFE
ncbi:MAG: hypothetical protein A2754_00025 [Candidatus Magasanikbacteria bacterium RIFCSPHIGHO2_01_FULL_47_8]|uniref:TVP38/TMEM64 family membrane protein n=1 Tax=Candidatus Magasanikbacteria bacterium RIFCSPHIGHO2_01_FULL_47_8 TaxID=1798673 RepID=A0A1F6MAZ0_9BACT|nr:MAG: hypothetical protein A2754_00025 [Candidatus Magasanikbacteria bacterium RIFCSPHIGHO2_01_FULL_47_8]